MEPQHLLSRYFTENDFETNVIDKEAIHIIVQKSAVDAAGKCHSMVYLSNKKLYDGNSFLFLFAFLTDANKIKEISRLGIKILYFNFRINCISVTLLPILYSIESPGRTNMRKREDGLS